MEKKTVSKVAFVVGLFPVASETWLLSQITGLIDRDIEVDVYTFARGETEKVPNDYFKYRLVDKTYLMDFPKKYLLRYSRGVSLWIKMLSKRPSVALQVINVFKYGTEAASLKLLYKIAPFVGRESQYDLIHCHFGPIANKFIPVKEILGLKQPLIVTFYGYDISHIPQEKGADVYGPVIKHFDRFLMMTENMKQRAVSLGFPEDKTIVHPISIDVINYPFKERKLENTEQIRMTAVGRFVEKKGFDDLIRAIGLVKKNTALSFKVNLIGDGELRSELEQLAEKNDVTDVIDFCGYMKLDDIKAVYNQTHLYLQPSKTAKNGDME